MRTGGNARTRRIRGPPSQIVVATRIPSQSSQNAGHGRSAAGANSRAITGEYRNAPMEPTVWAYGSAMSTDQYAYVSAPRVCRAGAPTTRIAIPKRRPAMTRPSRIARRRVRLKGPPSRRRAHGVRLGDRTRDGVDRGAGTTRGELGPRDGRDR